MLLEKVFLGWLLTLHIRIGATAELPDAFYEKKLRELSPSWCGTSFCWTYMSEAITWNISAVHLCSSTALATSILKQHYIDFRNESLKLLHSILITFICWMRVDENRLTLDTLLFEKFGCFSNPFDSLLYRC